MPNATITLPLGTIEVYEWYIWAFAVMQLAFAFAFGACLGSLVNVLVYRLPRGLGVVTPPSACPSCGTVLTWRENIPVFGWLFLRGRCRFCNVKISPEYPIVEAVVGVLFAVFYALWYLVPHWSTNTRTLAAGIDWTSIGPMWSYGQLSTTWPAFLVLLILIVSLVAMTLVDAKTFTIPLMLAWVPTAVALLAHPLHAWWAERYADLVWFKNVRYWDWTIATPTRYGWNWVGAALAGTLGLAIGNLLLHFNLIRRSFADYEQWEAGVRAQPPTPEASDSSPSPPLAAPGANEPHPQATAELWVQYPHARREALKELVFLAPCISLAWAGWVLGPRLGGTWTYSPIAQELIPDHRVPLWLLALTGVLLGYLVGGGIVWLVRIAGSLALGKEAMGLGDVHLLAAVGACLGWTHAVLAFFGAAFVALAWTGLAKLVSGRLQRVLPYGPYLAAATLLVLLGKPAIEVGLAWLTKSPEPVRLP